MVVFKSIVLLTVMSIMIFLSWMGAKDVFAYSLYIAPRSIPDTNASFNLNFERGDGPVYDVILFSPDGVYLAQYSASAPINIFSDFSVTTEGNYPIVMVDTDDPEEGTCGESYTTCINSTAYSGVQTFLYVGPPFSFQLIGNAQIQEMPSDVATAARSVTSSVWVVAVISAGIFLAIFLLDWIISVFVKIEKRDQAIMDRAESVLNDSKNIDEIIGDK